MAKLRDEDRRAVDLLLDRAAAGVRPLPAGSGNGDGNGNGNGNGHHAAMMAGGFSQVGESGGSRVPAVQKVFQVLDMLPDEEPPADLVVRTLRRLENATADSPGALRPPQHVMPSAEMPHA